MAKCLQIIHSCNECPRRRYFSGGQYECAEVGARLQNDVRIPEWCPLPEHPANVAARADEHARIGRTIMESLVRECEKDNPNISQIVHSVFSASGLMGIPFQFAAQKQEGGDK